VNSYRPHWPVVASVVISRGKRPQHNAAEVFAAKAAVSNRAHARLHRRTEISLLLHRYNDATAQIGRVVLPYSYAIYSLVRLLLPMLIFHATANMSTSKRSSRLNAWARAQTQRQTCTAALRQPRDLSNQRRPTPSYPPLAPSRERRGHGRQAGWCAFEQTARYAEAGQR
jgi:hypothetical protein